MKPKTMILTIVAVTCGLAASYMTSRLLAEREPEQVQTVKVLIAKRNLNMGDLLKKPEELFEFKEFPVTDETFIRDGIKDIELARNRQMKVPRRAGDVIRGEDLLSNSDPAAFFQDRLPVGYRAVGLRVNLEGGAAGWATLPMSRVDVINTVKRGDDAKSFSHFLFENVLVLGIDGQTNRSEDGKAMPGSVVIFALSPENVLRLNNARDGGSLSLAPRKMDDNEKAGIERVSYAETLSGGGSRFHSSSPLESGLDSGFTPSPTEKNGQSIASLFPKIDAASASSAEEVRPPEAPKEPQGVNHTLVITEGGQARGVNFLLHPRTGQVISNPEVHRSELPPAAPSTKVDKSPL